MEEFEILQEKENPLFNRREVKLVVEDNVTPKKSDAGEFLAEKFSTSINNIKIKKILGKFGSNKFTITANIYSSKEDKEKIEPKNKKEQKSETKTEIQSKEVSAEGKKEEIKQGDNKQ